MITTPFGQGLRVLVKVCQDGFLMSRIVYVGLTYVNKTRDDV